MIVSYNRDIFLRPQTGTSLSTPWSSTPPRPLTSPDYFRVGQEPLARLSLVSAASLSTCITRAFAFLLSSIVDGSDSGRF